MNKILWEILNPPEFDTQNVSIHKLDQISLFQGRKKTLFRICWRYQRFFTLYMVSNYTLVCINKIYCIFLIILFPIPLSVPHFSSNCWYSEIVNFVHHMQIKCHTFYAFVLLFFSPCIFFIVVFVALYLLISC